MGAAVYLVFAARSLTRDAPDLCLCPLPPLALPWLLPRTPSFPNPYLGHGAAPPGAI